jgi:hypothetical protein
MRIIGRSEHMYAPGRDIEQGIYDHFVTGLIERTLVPTPNLFQSLRVKLAESSKSNPLLARALATAAGIHADTDLVTAARTAAVLETLDDIASGNSSEYFDALVAVREPGAEPPAAGPGRPRMDPQMFKSLRIKHADLRQRSEQRQISDQDLGEALVQYYIDQGKRQLDERFFPAENPARTSQESTRLRGQDSQ